MNSQTNDHTHCPLCGSCGAGRQQQSSMTHEQQHVFPQDNVVYPPSLSTSQPKKRRGRPPGSGKSSTSTKKSKSGKKK